MCLYRVVRPKDTVDVRIMKHKASGKFSFVNITKGHICPCEFLTVKEALEDMDKQILDGRIIEYYIVE